MSEKRLNSSSVQQSERGMISIMTTMVLMIVISLIVLGFSQIARRNQRESLDRQLSTQAFYAAESGINDARKIMQTKVAAGLEVQPKTNCDGTGSGGFFTGLSYDIDPAKNVKYTCLLVDPSPKSLSFTNVGNVAAVVPVISESGDPISNIKLDWQSKLTSGSPLTGCPIGVNNVFSPTGSWSCGYGVLRFDLVPTAGTFSTGDLQNRAITVFAIPQAAGGVNTINYPVAAIPSTANANNRVGVSCTNTGCSLTIGSLSANNYHLRISSLYKDVALQVSATGASGSTLRISGSQAVIDSTGKAQDVLRRIQVRVPLRTTSQNQLSDYAIETNGALCKRYSIMSGFISNSVSGVVDGNQLCQQFNSP